MDIIKTIGKVARNNYLAAFFNALEKENIKSELSIEELKNFTLFLLGNEEIIKKWESYLELADMPNWSLQDRRERIIYTLNSNETCTVEFLKKQALTFTNGEIDVIEDFANYHFVIQFTSMLGVPPNIDNFRNMVDINKPAHLTYDIKYRYRTWGEISPFTWLGASKYTWAEARSREHIKEV